MSFGSIISLGGALLSAAPRARFRFELLVDLN